MKKKDIKFDKRATKYDDSFEGKGSKRFYYNLVNQVDLFENCEVLDVGCGTGTILYRLNQKCRIHGHGIDVEKKMLDQAKAKLPNMNLVLGICTNLPFPDESMDVITVCMAFHHFEDQQEFLKEAHRVLRPSGILYLCDPRFPFLIRKLFDCIALIHKINAKFFRNKNLIEFVTHNNFNLVKNKKDAYVQVASFQKEYL